MCGICGIFKGKGKKAEEKILKNMVNALIHRGPDDEGGYTHNEISIGMRRLSIIDIDNGKQPMTSLNGRYIIVFNGEIYNYKEVRKDLIKKGIFFKTESDTEVIINVFEYFGVEGIHKLNGMFAFAIFDKKHKKLFIVRDRLGVKPIYYSLLEDGTFIFASEIKSLITHPKLRKELNPKSIDHLLTFGFQLAPDTFFKNIFQVLPGHYLEIDFEKIKQKKYWDLSIKKEKKNISTKDAALELREELNKSVKTRLISDVPIAAYLSGGIDSSSVSKLYSLNDGGVVNTFSIGFPHKDYNELKYSDMLAKEFGTNHVSFMCDPKEEDFDKLIYYLEEPMITLLNLPLYYLSKTVKEHGYKVVLSGDGADEFLGGYMYFKYQKMLHFLSKNSSPYRMNLLKKLSRGLDEYDKQKGFLDFLLMQRNKAPSSCRNISHVFYTLPYKDHLLSKDMLNLIKESESTKLIFNPDELKNMELMDQCFYIESKFRLLNMSLPLSDKMSMANSVENRSPFLDYKFIEFLMTIPNYMKIHGLNEKFILKKAMKNDLPKIITNRVKKPLSAPAKWFMDIIGEKVDYYLSDDVIKAKGYFNLDYINTLKKQFIQNKRDDYANIFFIIFVMHRWDDMYLN